MPNAPLLLIPGPVSTDTRVRAAAAADYAPWDLDFRAVYARVRHRVTALAGGTPERHATLPLPGCGHFAMEAVIRSFLPEGGRLLIPGTGQYAERIARLATEAGRVVIRMPVPEGRHVDPAAVQQALEADPSITHLACVYSETSTGLIHDVTALAEAAGRAGRRVLVDAVSALGALPFDIGALPMVDSVTVTSNKCVEGLPGTSFTIAPIDRLEACKGNAGSWSFDLPALYQHAVEQGWGSHRFTPAAQAIAAFDVALDIMDEEGGRPARLARYTANSRALHEGARAIGLTPTLPLALQGPIVTNIDAPADPAWNLQRFVDGLKARGFIISNFYNTRQPSFRVGTIGAITPDDMRRFVAAMAETLSDMGITHRQAA